MTAYIALVKEGFPKMLVLQAFRDGGRIPQDADLDELLLEWEGELQLAREEEEARNEAAAAAAAANGGLPIPPNTNTGDVTDDDA